MTSEEKHEPLWTEHGYIVCRCGWEYDDPNESYFDHIAREAEHSPSWPDNQDSLISDQNEWARTHRWGPATNG